MVDETKYEDLGNTIAQLAEEAEKKLKDAVLSREQDAPVAEKAKPKKSPATKASDRALDRQSKTLLNAVHTLEEKTHSLEVVIEGLRKERAQLMGRIRALNALVAKVQSANR